MAEPGLSGLGVVPRLGVFSVRSGPVDPAASEVVSGAGLDQMAAVYLDAASPQAKTEIVGLVLAAQNGVNTFARSAPNCFMGDTAIQVALAPAPGGRDLVLDVTARLRPRHLTQAFVLRGGASRRDVEAFLAMFKLTRNYVLTVALDGTLDLGSLYVVKYYVRGRVPR